MHERSIVGLQPKPSPDIELTSFIYRIFGGRIRSQVKCSQCGYESNTYDPFLDLSLEINHAHTIEKALKLFTAVEVLDGGNKYKCPRQNKAVRAEKRITIESSPNVLVLQLKRFEFSFSGRKVSKPVAFTEVLDLSPYLSNKPHEPLVYDLYGVLVHQGHSMHSGHYFCFIKSSGGSEWHKFDDTRVHATALRNVMGQLPYILFYIRRQPIAPSKANNTTNTAPKPKLERPIMQTVNGKRNGKGDADGILGRTTNVKRKRMIDDGEETSGAKELVKSRQPDKVLNPRTGKEPAQKPANPSIQGKEVEIDVSNIVDHQYIERDMAHDTAGRRFR